MGYLSWFGWAAVLGLHQRMGPWVLEGGDRPQ